MSSGTKKFLMAHQEFAIAKPILRRKHVGANGQGVLCGRFVAAGDDGQAADARADVPELVLAAKHAPGCAAALVCATFMGLECGGVVGGFAHVRI